MQRFVTRSGRLLGVAAIAGALFLPAVLAQEGKPAGSLAERRDGAMTAEALREAPGQNRMVWVSAPRAAKLPTLDGTLNLEQGEWADAAAIPGMLAPTGSRLLPLQSLTLITWDEDSFYLGMRTEVKPGYVLRRRGREHDGAEGVNRDDAVEIFFNPLGRDQPEPAIFQVMFNALGFRWDAMQTVGVTAKYWDADTWEFKSDYKPGMTHWDLEVEIPARSMRMRSPNRSGDCWLFLATRDWKWLIDEKGSSHWNIYSSLTGNGGFISQENQFPLVLDDSAPVVQLLDISDLWKGRFGFKARFANTTARPQSFTALASVYDNSGYQGRDKDRSEREKPLAMQSKQFTLRPGEAVEWAIRGAALPEPAAQLYGLVFKVSRAGSATPLFVRQCDFTKLEYTAKQVARGYAIDIAYNPARGNLMPSCDILDHPDQSKVKGLRVELPPLLDTVVTRVGHHVISDLLPLPALKPGSYPARLTLLDTDGKAIESKELAVEKLDEAATFPWWDSPAGLSDKPIPPHQPMRVEGNAVITTTGRVAFDGRAMPTQVQMAGRELLAAPVRLTASAGGQAVAFVADAAPGFGRKTATEVELSGALRSNELTAKVANRMEYDGAQWITLDIEPAAPELKLDYLRLELPFKPERAQFLYTMAMAGRESWVAEDIANGEGTVWDSARCRGLGMTVGSFMPQYVVSDSLGGLCWYADNDRGWVPTDDVPAAEALRQGGETALRFNLIGKPFALKGPRRIQFGLLGLPARPFPPGARIVERRTSQFGHYVGDKVMNYSAPMPRDFAKARDFMEKGTRYDSKTYEPVPKAVAKDWLMEFAPWHDSHTPWKTPDLHPKTYDYLAREFDGYGFVPKLVNLRAWQWERYVRAAPIDGIYYDTPEGMGYSRSVQNGVAYVIPDGQPHAGEVQGGYNLTGFREQIKRIATVFHQNGVDNPWVEMHSTHGPVVPATGFLNVLLDGEDFRRPSFRNFMYAWPVRHLRAIDSPSLYGLTIRWLGGYPWDNQARNVDPLRCQMAALFVHDVWTPGFGSWSQNTVAGKGVLIQKCDREPPYGFRNPDMAAKLIGLGMNLSECRFLPYWDNADVLTLTPQTRGTEAPPTAIALAAWRVPSQRRLIVAVDNPGARAVGGKLKLDLGKLGLMPANSGECIIISELATDKVLLKTTGMNRGKLLGLWKGLRDAEGRKVNSPHDDVNISVPAGAGAFFMVATQ